MDFVVGNANAPARGNLALVNCEGSVLAEVVDNIVYNTHNAHTKCLPLHMLESIYARVVVLGDDALADEFGVSMLSPALIVRVEAMLKQLNTRGVFSFNTCSHTEYIRRLLEVPTPSLITCNQADLVECELSAANNKWWADAIPLSDLVSVSNDRRLVPYADLAALLGPRNLAASRQLVASNRYAVIFKQLQSVARTFDSLDDAPGNQGGDFLSKPPDATEVLEAIGAFLEQVALPVQLLAQLHTQRDARLDIRFREEYALKGTAASKNQVIRQRLGTLLLNYPALTKVLGSNDVSTQLELVSLLMTKMDIDGDGVSGYHILDAKVAALLYVLDVGDDAVALTSTQKVEKIVAAHDAVADRKRAAPRATDGAASVVVGAASSSDHGVGAGAAAFKTANADAMEKFLTLHAAAMVTKLSTPERNLSDSPLSSGDSSRILRVVFRSKLVPFWQFGLRPESTFSAPVFELINPYRTGLDKYLSESVVQDDDGNIPKRAGGFSLSKHFLADFRALRWEKLDMYNELRAAVLEKKEPGGGHRLAWPADVFRSGEALRHVKELGDKLFAAIGYPVRSRRSFYGKIGRLQKFLDDHCPRDANPAPKLFECYEDIIRSAAVLARHAMAAGPDFAFPEFGSDDDLWVASLASLEAAADALRGQDDLRPASRGLVARSGRAVAFDSDTPNRHSSPSPARSVDLSFSPSSGGSKITVGDRAADVYIDAATLRITFRGKDTTSTYEWKVPEVKRIVKRSEGTDAKCLSCAVVRTANRCEFCSSPGAPGHESETSSCHTFKGEPWNVLAKLPYSRRL